jgi:hypothetical protein
MTARAETVPVPRPFHETIIGAFKRATTGGECLLLLELIIETSIPKGHDEIIAALDGGPRHGEDTYYFRRLQLAIGHLRDQKNIAAKKSEKAKE